MLRREVLKLGLVFPFLKLGPFLRPKLDARILVTIVNHSDSKPFLVEIEGDKSTLSVLRSEINRSGKFQSLAMDLLSWDYLCYYTGNRLWEDVILTALERYDNVDYKVKVKPVFEIRQSNTIKGYFMSGNESYEEA